MTDQLLTCKEVSAMLRISVPSLYRRMADGTLPKPLKLGSASRWPQSEILAAMKAAAGRRAA